MTIMCDDCEDRAATIKCGCGEHYCYLCFFNHEERGCPHTNSATEVNQ